MNLARLETRFIGDILDGLRALEAELSARAARLAPRKRRRVRYRGGLPASSVAR
jgi:hypothetical protein